MGSDADAVWELMKTANRPFSGNDVFSRLQRQRNDIGKSAVDRALDRLVNENKIFVKLYGKQKIYCAVQREAAAEDDDGKEMLDEELSKAEEALRLVERRYRQSEMEIKTLRSTVSTAEAERKVAETERTVSELGARLDGLRQQSAGRDAVSEEDVKRVKKEYEKAMGEYRKRKRMCTDVLDSILEEYPKRKKDLLDEIGIETDESAGMPSDL